MAFSKSVLVTLLSILCTICFQTLISANDQIDECITVLKDFCNDDQLDLQKCVKRAIMHWTHDTVDQKYLKKYYKHIGHTLKEGDGMLDPINFCADKEESCLTDLKEFIRWVRYNPDNRDFKKYILTKIYLEAHHNTNDRPNNYLIDYLRHVLKNVDFIKENAIAPEVHCRKWSISNYDSDKDPDYEFPTIVGFNVPR